MSQKQQQWQGSGLWNFVFVLIWNNFAEPEVFCFQAAPRIQIEGVARASWKTFKRFIVF